MHVIVNIFFLFLFLLASLYFKVPDISNNKYILHKFVIFITVFVFQFIVQISSKIANKCKINIGDIAFDAMIVATAALIGYSIYNDLLFSGTIKKFYDLECANKNILYLNIVIIMILFICFVKVIGILIYNQSRIDICEK